MTIVEGTKGADKSKGWGLRMACIRYRELGEVKGKNRHSKILYANFFTTVTRWSSITSTNSCIISFSSLFSFSNSFSGYDLIKLHWGHCLWVHYYYYYSACWDDWVQVDQRGKSPLTFCWHMLVHLWTSCLSGGNNASLWPCYLVHWSCHIEQHCTGAVEVAYLPGSGW